jgi:tRNA(Arg) A34 adenosine deaminase TadA
MSLLRRFASLFVGIIAACGWAGASPGVPAALPDDPACTPEDRKFMQRALELAQDSVARDWRPFSAVLVRDGVILAEYQNQHAVTHDVTQHAETGLISAFSPKIDQATLAQCTLYASSEPCTMCCGAIRFAGIGRVVYGVTEAQFELLINPAPNPQALTCRETLARTAPWIKVLGPLDEARGLAVHAAYWPKHPFGRRTAPKDPS